MGDDRAAMVRNAIVESAVSLSWLRDFHGSLAKEYGADISQAWRTSDVVEHVIRPATKLNKCRWAATGRRLDHRSSNPCARSMLALVL